MTLPKFEKLATYWRKYPPAPLLMRAFMGYKGDERRTGGLGELFAKFGQGEIIAGS